MELRDARGELRAEARRVGSERPWGPQRVAAPRGVFPGTGATQVGRPGAQYKLHREALASSRLTQKPLLGVDLASTQEGGQRLFPQTGRLR
jgi:hypothetical protein